jgi:prepilin-type N-terminal cleavage/methylation domain-containing protein
MITKIFRNRENGFTLIELLIVCILIGILAAAVLPNLTRFVGKSTEDAANTELATLRSGVTGYLVDHSGNLPCVVQPTADNPQPLVAASITPYLGNGPILGGYLVDIDANLAGDPANVYPGLNWDAANGKWTK